MKTKTDCDYIRWIRHR